MQDSLKSVFLKMMLYWKPKGFRFGRLQMGPENLHVSQVTLLTTPYKLTAQMAV